MLLLVKSQILLGIKIFPAYVTSFDFVDFTVPDEILGGVKDFCANYARRLFLLKNQDFENCRFKSGF